MTTEKINELCVLDISEDPDGNAESGERILQKLQTSEVRVEGAPVRGLYIPKLFSEGAIRILRTAGDIMSHIAVKAIGFYRKNEEFRRLYSFPKELESLALRDTGYGTAIPILRVDLFYDEITGGFKLCELNTDGTSGMIEDSVLCDAFSETVLGRKIQDNFELQNFELFDSLALRYMNIYRSTPGAENNPVCAIVDFLEYASSMQELERYKRSFEKLGVTTVIADIRSLRFDGKKLMTEDGSVIDMIYRRAVTLDIFKYRKDSEALISAAHAHAVVLMGDFSTQIIHDKAFFIATNDEAFRRILTPEEIRFIDKHVPKTVRLDKKALPEYRPEEFKDRWIIKPANSYGSRGISIGHMCASDIWKERLHDALEDGDCLLQEYVSPCRSLNIDYADKKPEIKSYYNTTGIYMFNGEFAGLYSRASEYPVISTSKGGFDLASVVAVKRDKPGM